MKFSILLLAIFLFSCNNNSNSEDSKTPDDDTVISSFLDELGNDKKLFDSTIEIVRFIHEEKGCNLLKQHFIVKTLNKSEDSIKHAVEFLSNQVYANIEKQDCGALKKRSAIYFYASEKNYRITKWLAMATNNEGGIPNVMLMLP